MSASGNAGTIGAPSGSPFIAANPLAASTSVPKPGRSLDGPVCPHPEIRTRISCGIPALQDVPAETHALERAGHERLQDDVESRNQTAQQILALR